MDRFEAAGGYDADKRIANVLTGLGFKQEDWNKSCSEFSGGWQVQHLDCLYRKATAHPAHVCTATESTPCLCLSCKRQHTLFMYVPQATAHPVHDCASQQCYTWLMQVHKGWVIACNSDIAHKSGVTLYTNLACALCQSHTVTKVHPHAHFCEWPAHCCALLCPAH